MFSEKKYFLFSGQVKKMPLSQNAKSSFSTLFKAQNFFWYDFLYIWVHIFTFMQIKAKIILWAPIRTVHCLVFHRCLSFLSLSCNYYVSWIIVPFCVSSVVDEQYATQSGYDDGGFTEVDLQNALPLLQCGLEKVGWVLMFSWNCFT